jgi:hypothetical protein
VAPWHVVLELVAIKAPLAKVSDVDPGANVSLRPVARLPSTETPEVPGVVALPLVHAEPPPVTVTGPSPVTPIRVTEKVFGFVSDRSSVPVPPGKSRVVTVAVACSTTTAWRCPTLTSPVPEPVAEK